MNRFYLLTFSLIFYFSIVKSQDKISVINEFKKFDLSDLWICDSIESRQDIVIVDNKEMLVYGKCRHSEPLGFIGENYQRFWIHYDNIKQSKTNPLEYFVSGKTKVDSNICSFEGKIIITEAYKNNDSGYYYKDFYTGMIIGKYEFNEQKDQSASGYFKGTFYTNWAKNIKKGLIQYNALDAVADGFCNNQFTGTWTSYKSGMTKRCNWGDYRIPDSKDLDWGTGEFSVNPKYVKFGWLSYSKAWSGNQDSKESIQARLIESQKWWIIKNKK